MTAAAASDLVVLRPEGMYCPAGQFFIDPWRPVERAVITHAHADHARVGHGHYLAAQDALAVLRARLGPVSLQGLAYGERLAVGDVTLSLHPAGHVLGSAQVRIEHAGAVWVASGDYKTAGVRPGSGDLDPTCAPFEPVRCDVFITESTFGLPIYRWPSQADVLAAIGTWWTDNAAVQRPSVLYAYSFGKAQRILAGLQAAPGPIVCHGAMDRLNRAYRDSGVALPATARVDEVEPAALRRALVVAPPSAAGSPWLRRFGQHSDAFASGWMQLRGTRRRQALDRGFVLSDHADWPGLLWAIGETGAGRVIVTHGQIAPLVRWLCEAGIDGQAFETEYGDEEGADVPLEAA